MSKLHNSYLKLKEYDSDILYLFKSGMFYIFIGKDAELISELVGLKLANLNNEVVKCGFPKNSLEKYMNIFMENNLKVIIVEKDKVINYDEQYLENIKVIDFIKKIKNTDIYSITPINALEILENFKKEITYD
ncbi:MAG: hypothetical protein PHY00_00640 [Bacilli bacterium]|nr:hypothetical protein [Bacilli bacterium]